MRSNTQYASLMLNGEFDWKRWFKFAVNPFAGNFSDFRRAITDPLANGAPGKVNYKSIAFSAFMAAVLPGGGGIISSVANAAVTTAVASKLGMGPLFSWKNLLKSAVAQQVGQAVTGSFNTAFNGPTNAGAASQGVWSSVE